MITWFVAALVCATSLAQQSQGLVSQSTLPPPSPAGSTDRTEAKTQADARKASAPTDAPKPATAKKSGAETKAAETPPPAEAPKAEPEKKKSAAGSTRVSDARVAAFWFMLPRK